MPSTTRGSLTLAGAGVTSIGHLTLQTVAAIENADIVCYILNDPVTEAFIIKKNPNVYDLYQLYDDGKPRIETYHQMVEVLMSKVRSGQDVVGLFTGHPGVVNTPAAQAFKIARQEGYTARMLPGITTNDALLADVVADPALGGAMAYEATDFLNNNRVLHPEMNVFIQQVGVVGNKHFNFMEMRSSLLDKLIDRLEETYGGEKEIIHYIAPMLPIDKPVMQKMTVSDLKKPEYKAKIVPSSTFYITPNEQLSSVLDSTEGKKLHREAMSALANHTHGKNYAPMKENLALTEALERLALEPKSLEAYRSDPQSYVNENGRGLTEEERKALVTGRGIRELLSDGPVAAHRIAPLALV